MHAARHGFLGSEADSLEPAYRLSFLGLPRETARRASSALTEGPLAAGLEHSEIVSGSSDGCASNFMSEYPIFVQFAKYLLPFTNRRNLLNQL
jgi:hypothetical protein